ncbi:MAG: glycosyltransferase family 2 protein [Bacilli bacterium]|nr:glycosyltransferase family 2 protein [Bacilli bacterium]
MKKPLVTIIIPVYNAEKYIGKCLESVCNQEYNNLEIIVVDDGSKDDSSRIINEYSKRDSRIKYINQENKGVSFARNVALKVASGEYIQFTDSDDILKVDMIKKMVNVALKNNSDIVICGYDNYIEASNEVNHIHLNKYNLSFKEVISNEATNYGGFPWNKLIKKDCIKKEYRTDIHFYENLLLFLDNSIYIKNYSIIDEPLYVYNINNTSAVHTKKYNKKRMTMLKALEYVIKSVDIKYKDYYIYLFVNKYYENYIYLKRTEEGKIFRNTYFLKVKSYKKIIFKSKTIGLKYKVKLFIICYLNPIYTMAKLRKMKR